MQTWLVALIVIRTQPGKGIDFLSARENLWLRCLEDIIETTVELFIAYLRDKFVSHVRHVESVLHGVAFLKATPYLHRIEVGDELTIFQTWMHIT